MLCILHVCIFDVLNVELKTHRHVWLNSFVLRAWAHTAHADYNGLIWMKLPDKSITKVATSSMKLLGSPGLTWQKGIPALWKLWQPLFQYPVHFVCFSWNIYNLRLPITMELIWLDFGFDVRLRPAVTLLLLFVVILLVFADEKKESLRLIPVRCCTDNVSKQQSTWQSAIHYPPPSLPICNSFSTAKDLEEIQVFKRHK